MDKKQKNILIIEDEPAYQNSLVHKLSAEGFAVAAANNGEEGLTVALETHPDLILLDLLMPNKGGIAVLDKLREDEWGKDAKVAVITNFSGETPVSRALDNGVAFYFVKSDTTLESLVEKVTDLLN